MLFNENYGFLQYLKRRIKSLLLPYFCYAGIYLLITAAITPLIGKFWGLNVNLYNEIIVPFLNGHQLDLISPLWFVPQLFTTLIIYWFTNRLRTPVWLYFILALTAIQMGSFRESPLILYGLRTMFSLMFVHLGYLYNKKEYNIFTPKIFTFVILIQALLWITNKDFTAEDGIGLSYILVWGNFNNWIVPILTSLTGIWAALFIIEISYNYIKNCRFLHIIGQNTYHIMANHLLVFNIITYTILALKGIPFDIKNSADIYWFYYPLKTTYIYFLAGVTIPAMFSEGIKQIKRICQNKANIVS